MSDLCQHIDRGTEHVQVFWVFQRAVKAAEVTKSVQETLNGKKNPAYFLNWKNMGNKIKRASGNRINYVQVLSGGKKTEGMEMNR